ncbi:group 1 glycosyl transferase [Tolypothrix sp. NIES-4075]|uniref:glycosyltransferase family 4 protein n=1 Tax=Tolypothrix sp. NIES-4075 TaxID=2005459 RepID=UPI000B5CD3F7|nr:glycosyltransferase family 4 protein [Tolypothrix sp. NIES-4075]GAX42853.1 group 1 glycosyl transferase [Tolypothrix sp. NIES-4075]
MKILIQHRHYENEISGVLTYIYSIIPELQTRKIEVKTISTKQDNIAKWFSYIAWADIVHMNSNDLSFALLCKSLRKKIIIKYHYCLYQSTHTTYEPMKLTQRLKAEFKQTLPKANYPLKWKLHTFVKWARLLTRFSTAFLADYHTACSNFLGESSAFPWSVDTIYNPIQIKSTNQLKTKENLSHPYKFIFVGRLATDKGVDIFLKAARILQDEKKEFKIIIIGDGEQSQELKQLTSNLEIANKVNFLGKVAQKEVLLKVQDALALIAPSRWQDPAPYVVQEASSVQTCSIVSKMGGLPEVAGPHSLFFENEDVEELAKCMRYCLDNPDEAINRGFLSSQYVAEKFSAARAVTRLLEICSKFIPKALET